MTSFSLFPSFLTLLLLRGYENKMINLPELSRSGGFDRDRFRRRLMGSV